MGTRIFPRPFPASIRQESRITHSRANTFVNERRSGRPRPMIEDVLPCEAGRSNNRLDVQVESCLSDSMYFPFASIVPRADAVSIRTARSRAVWQAQQDLAERKAVP